MCEGPHTQVLRSPQGLAGPLVEKQQPFCGRPSSSFLCPQAYEYGMQLSKNHAECSHTDHVNSTAAAVQRDCT